MKILRMEECHLHALADIEKQCFGAPWSEDGLREELENPTACFLVAQDENCTICGYIGCHFILDEGYITNVAVAKQERRRGTAKALVSALLAQAREKKLQFVTLEARVSNVAAIALYEQAGFTPVGKRKNYYAAPREDALLMTWFAQSTT